MAFKEKNTEKKAPRNYFEKLLAEFIADGGHVDTIKGEEYEKLRAEFNTDVRLGIQKMNRQTKLALNSNN